MATNDMTRRGFVTALLGVPLLGAFGVTGAAIGQFVYPPDSLTKAPDPKVITKTGQLKKTQGFKFDFDGLPGVLVKTGDGEGDSDYVAYSIKCTHLGCTVGIVDIKDMTKGLVCPCHGGKYELDGKNVPGTPPPKPLPRYAMEIKGGEIVITGLKKEA